MWASEAAITPECRDLIDNLLVVDPTKRLGHKGAWEIKMHPFFNGINWDALENRESDAAFVPRWGTLLIFCAFSHNVPHLNFSENISHTFPSLLS